MSNPIAWVEIPVKEMDRAISFYNAVFDWNLEVNLVGPPQMAFFPNHPNMAGGSGALIKMNKFYKPAKASGPLIYLAHESVSKAVKRIEEYGGNIMIDKKEISPEHGYMAVFLDTEGNRMAIIGGA